MNTSDRGFRFGAIPILKAHQVALQTGIAPSQEVAEKVNIEKKVIKNKYVNVNIDRESLVSSVMSRERYVF